MTKSTQTTKKSSVTPPQVESSNLSSLQHRPFPQETATKGDQPAAPTPISADWQAQQETVARARFNPDRISLYPIDPVKEERREKPIQKKAESASEPATSDSESEEKDKPIQKKAEVTPEPESEPKQDEPDKPIQKKAEEPTAKEGAEPARDTDEQEKPVQKKADATAAEKEPEKPSDDTDKTIQKKADAATPEQTVKPESESDATNKAVQKKAEETAAEPESDDKEKSVQKKAESTSEPEPEEKDKPIQKKAEPTAEADEDKAEPIQRKAESESAEEPEKQDDPVAHKAVQTKLTVGKVGDRYEQEADQVAAKVMTMPDPAQNHIQRQPHTAPADLQPKPLASAITPLVQQKSAEEIPAKPAQKKTSPADSHFEARLSSSMAGGSPLPEDVRSFMESRLGVGLKHVRTHTGPEAAQLTKELRAQAFTYRNHVFYASGKSPAKDELTAHELTHVIQQTGGQKLHKETVRRSPDSQNQEANQPKTLESTEAQDNKLAPSESAVQRHGISMISPRIQGNMLMDGLRVAGDVVTGDLEGAKRQLLDSVASFASGMPGYSLLTVVLGKDPIKDEPVERNATNLVQGILELVPGGDRMFKNLQESGALQKAFDWFEKELNRLNLTWNAIKTLFRRAVDALSESTILNPGGAIEDLANIFRDPIQRITRFALSVGQKVMEFVFEAAMAMAGKGGADRVMGILKKVGGLFMKIVKDPVGFVGNLVKSVQGGFENFSANIMKHLRAGLMGWLFGTLSGAGLQMPAALNLKGMLSIALQVAGATYQKLRKKLVKRMGEKKVSQVEKSFALLRSIASGGLIAAWKQISQSTGDVKEMVISEVRNWVITTIIKKAVLKLVSMFNPAGAVVQAVIAVYNTVMFFIERMQQIIELANAVFNSINSIAAGKIKAAIKFVEQSMAKSLPVIISFMARLLGLGGISKKIRNIIKRVQRPIDRAMSKIIDTVMRFARKLFKKNNKNRGKEILDPKNMTELRKDVLQVSKRRYKTVQEFSKDLKLIHRKYQTKGLKYIAVRDVQTDPKQPLTIFAKINPVKPLTIVHWDALFDRGHEPEGESVKYDKAGETTHAMLIVNGRMKVKKASSGKGHAEELIVNSPEWIAVLDKAFVDSTSKSKPKTTDIKLLVNRSTCHARCSPLLPKVTNAYWHRFIGNLSPNKKNTRFFLVMRGIYEGKEGPTTHIDLKELEASGWNLQVLWTKGKQPTTHGRILMRFVQQLKRVNTIK